MAEIREVKVKQIEERCPACGKGYMRPTGIQKMTEPVQYEHKCTSCPHKQYYSIRYPQIIL